MVFGDVSREDFLKHHDPQRWVVEGAAPPKAVDFHVSTQRRRDAEILFNKNSLRLCVFAVRHEEITHEK